MDHIACLAELIRAVQFMGGSFPQSLAERNRWARRIENGNRHLLLLIAFCGEVWETPGVFQRAVGRMRTRRVGPPAHCRKAIRRLSMALAALRGQAFPPSTGIEWRGTAALAMPLSMRGSASLGTSWSQCDQELIEAHLDHTQIKQAQPPVQGESSQGYGA